MEQIKIISDTHNDHNQLSDLECDILIHCGDANTKGNYTEGLNFLWWYVKQPAKHKILVPGNHDKKLREHPELIQLAKDMGIHVLNNDYLEINGIKFYGVSKTFWSDDRDKPGMAKTRQDAWKDIPEGIDILITHIPPKYILDQSLYGQHCGCPQLTKKVKEVKPTYHIFGHLHEHGGKSLEVYDTIFINTAVKNEMYFTVRGAYELYI